MASFSNTKKKKKKNEGGTSFEDYTRSVLGDSYIEDIAPVRSDIGTFNQNTERTWFQKSQGNTAQTILGSATDVTKNAGTGILGMGEKLLDTLAYFGAGANLAQKAQNGQMITSRDWDSYNEQMKASETFIKKDLYDEEEVARKIISDPMKKFTGVDSETMSVFGAKSDSLAQSAGQLGATMLLQAGGVPWWVTTGATSFGAETESALNQGATMGEAGLSAAIATGAEILSEKLSGGISFGGKTIDDALTKELSRTVSNKLVRTLLKLGVDTAGEGFEEIFSGYASALGQKLTYMDDKELNEIFSSEDALESFIGGAFLGGVSSAGKATTSSLKGVDYTSELTNNEDTVVRKVYEDAVAEMQKAEGRELTRKEKSKIYDETLNALEKGYIDTDVIESTLGGETYKKIQSLTEQETKLQEEYDTLNRMKLGEMTGEQTDRKSELKQQLEELKNKGEQSKLRTQLDSEMKGLIQGSRLSESYNEKGRRGQVLEVDVETYSNENAKQTAQNFKDFGANNTNASHDFLDFATKVAEDSGHTFKFMTTKQLEESIANGNPYNITEDARRVEAFVSESAKEIVINMDAKKSLPSLVGHEVMHTLEKANNYSDAQNALFEFAKTKGEYDDRWASIQRRYANLTEEQQKQELASDLAGDYIFGDTNFIKDLSTEKPNIFRKIYNEIKHLYKMATAGSREARELERVKRQFEKVWAEAQNTSMETTSVETNIESPETDIELDSNMQMDAEVAEDMKSNIAPTQNRLADDEFYQSMAYGDKIYGKDVTLESQNVVAPEKESYGYNYAPLTEEQANIRDAEHIDRQYFTDDTPTETEEQYNGTYAEHTTPYDPFYEKDIWEVGRDRKQKAYMYENPEVKPFFQEEANIMLGELNNLSKGEVFYNDQLYYDTNGEMGWFGTKRLTSDDIAYLLDTFNYSYKDVERGLRAIIEDNGKENNAVSKRIEFLLDERLRNGYTEFMFGDKIPPNQEYINLLNEKQVTEYNDESWNNWLRNLSEDDIKYLSNTREDVAPPDEYMVNESDVAPTREDVPLYETESGQLSMYEDIQTDEPKTITRSGLHSNIMNNVRNVFEAKGFNFDEVLKKAKNLSTFATVDNTPQRVMEKALGYKEGQVLSDLTVNKVAQNESEGIKWLNSFTDRKNGLLAKISKQYNIRAGSKKSAAAQMYAEGFYVNDANEIIAYGDAELAKDFPDPKVQENIKGLANDPRIRQIYDDTLSMINESRTRNAYPEIPRLDNYFLHFRAMDDTFSRLGLPFNPNDIRAKDLPTDLNGVTADLKPGQPYFASAMHRTGKRTSFDLLGGLERYLTSAKNQIYHIDDIQTLRAIRNYIADTYGQASGLENIDSLSEEEAQIRIEQVYNSHLSTFAKFLNEEANVLAGKTALIDRGLEGIIGRRGITFLNTVNGQVGSNMVGFNISSSLTNVLPVAQTFAKSNKFDFIKAFAQTTSNKIGSIFGKNDGFSEQSPVMIRRNGAERFYRTPWQKAGDTGYVLMSAVDNISTELVARTKYNELTRKGMDSQQAHYETDKWVSRLMGDRSLGQMPQLYNSKMLGLITKFQLEVRNQLDSQFYDTIQEAKVSSEDIKNGLLRNAKTAAKISSTFVQLAVVQHLFGKAFESVAGYNPAFDIIEVLLKTIGYDDDEDSEDTVLDNIEQGFLALLEDLPYTSTFTGGRIPITSALPVEELVTGQDEYGNDKPRLETLKEIAPYYLLPTGYGQLKKTQQGLSMFDDDLPISGSYTDSGNLRFPVEDTLKNRVQAGVFGQWSSDVAGDYFDNARNPLKEKQIEELIDLDMPIRDYWDYREGLAEQKTLEDKFEYVSSLDVTDEQKNIMINNVVDRKEKVDISNYDDFANYEEFDFYSKNKEKYEFLQGNGISYSEYVADDELKEDYDNVYTWYKNNPEKVTLASAVTDSVIEYKQFTKELDAIRADKDSNGNSISGTAKAKKTDYINSLDLDYGQKLILYRSLYDSKTDKATYNAEIVEYLNSREDISYEEMVTILEELDMKVHSDGTVTW